MAKAKRTPASDQAARALVIGVSDYPAPNSPLPGVAADVREMAKLLSSKNGSFPPEGVTVLTDKQATKIAVLTELRSVFESASEDDTVFVYMAGHGMKVGSNYYFVAYDTTSDSTGVPLHEIKSLFETTASRRAFLWLDFCHSGGILARGQNANWNTDFKRAIKVVNGEGRIIVAACSSIQSAYENSVLGHGLFTHALLRGLKGEAKSSQGEVTAASLYDFITHEIKHPDQRPEFSGHMVGRIILAHYADRNATASTTKTPTKPKATGTWVMIGDNFLLAQSIRHSSDTNVTITIAETNGEDDASIAALRPDRYGGRSSLPFAAENEAFLAQVKTVENETTNGQKIWTLTLYAEESRFGDAMEMSLNCNGKIHTADDIATLKAGRILLNNPAPRLNRRWSFDSEDSLLSMVEGSGKYPVTNCIVRDVHATYGDNSTWRDIARLKCIFQLKAAHVVDQILELNIGTIKDGTVSITFRGRRPAHYSNVKPKVIELNGSCPLTD